MALKHLPDDYDEYETQKIGRKRSGMICEYYPEIFPGEIVYGFLDVRICLLLFRVVDFLFIIKQPGAEHRNHDNN